MSEKPTLYRHYDDPQHGGVRRAMAFTSPDAFHDFDRSVRRKLRYVRQLAQDEFLRTVVTTSHTREKKLNAGDILWRAQLGHCWHEEERGDGTYRYRIPYGPKRMKPIPEKALDGRVNPKGIVCLYLATDTKTAVLETRPVIGSYVSVAQFRVLQNMTLVNCGADKYRRTLADLVKDSWTVDEIERKVWSDINRAFSQPARRSDDGVDYVATQILSEVFKFEGFDGIEYESGYGENGVNIALFDIRGADSIKYYLHRVDDVSVKISQEYPDDEWMLLISAIHLHGNYYNALIPRHYLFDTKAACLIELGQVKAAWHGAAPQDEDTDIACIAFDKRQTVGANMAADMSKQ